MKRGFVLSVVLCIMALASVCSAAQFKCGDTQFQTEPHFGADKNFVIPLYSDCTIAQTTLADLKIIQNWIAKSFPKTTTIDSGPNAETFQNMPSFALAVTDAADDGRGDTLTIKSDVHIATDSANRLVYQNTSNNVKGTGDSGFLREFDVAYSITKSADGFNVKFSHTLHIAKPWYAPTGTFQKDAVKGVSQDFVSSRDDFMKSLTAQF